MRLGVMNSPKRPVREEIMAIGKAGYDFVDLTLEGPNAREVDARATKRLLQEFGLAVVGHTDPCLPYAYPIGSIRDACLEELKRCAQILSEVGASVMNIHPCYSSPPGMKKDIIRLNMDALGPIVELAKDAGLILVLENFKPPFDRVSVFTALFNALPGLRLHLDVGHTNMGGDDEEVFCGTLGAHIKHVHFSDNRATDDHHMPLGVGTVAWKRAIGALKSCGYDDTITLEVFCEDRTVLFDYLEVGRGLVRRLWKETGRNEQRVPSDSLP